MPRSDYSRYDDEPRRARGGLSLSTGRFEGRSSMGDAPSRTRHNPLRDDYTDRPARPERGGYAGSSGRRGAEVRDRGTERLREDRAARGPARQGARHSGRGRATLAPAASPFEPRAHTIGSHGTAAAGLLGGLDVRRLGMLVGGVALAAIVVMAIAHIGPFAPAATTDGAKHAGVQSANAVQGVGAYASQGVATQISLARPVEPDLAKLPAHAPTREDVTSLAGQKEPFAFSLAAAEDGDAGAAAPVLSDRSLVNLSNALAYYDANGYEASYLFMDLGTGRGIAGNLDVPIYGASSFKGPYCAYVVNKEFPNDIDRARSSRLTQVENTIVWSDNSSYGKLRRTYGDEGMEAWLAEAGVDTALVNDTFFPTYTARQSALMWLKIYDYLTNAGTSAAQWLSDTFAKTEVSFLRNGALGTTSAGHTDYLPEEGSGTEEGVEEAQADEGAGEEESEDAEAGQVLVAAEGASEGEGELLVAADAGDETKAVASIGSNITVRNKAGWINGEEDDAVCDAGIVTINGRDYLMVIMTSAPDCAEGEQAFAHLARTLFEIRGDLV